MIDKRKGENRRNEAISTALGGGYLSKKKRWANRLKEPKQSGRSDGIFETERSQWNIYLHVQRSTSYLKY